MPKLFMTKREFSRAYQTNFKSVIVRIARKVGIIQDKDIAEKIGITEKLLDRWGGLASHPPVAQTELERIARAFNLPLSDPLYQQLVDIANAQQQVPEDPVVTFTDQAYKILGYPKFRPDGTQKAFLTEDAMLVSGIASKLEDRYYASLTKNKPDKSDNTKSFMTKEEFVRTYQTNFKSVIVRIARRIGIIQDRDIAAKLGITEKLLDRWGGYETHPPTDQAELEKIAKVFNLPLTDPLYQQLVTIATAQQRIPEDPEVSYFDQALAAFNLPKIGSDGKPIALSQFELMIVSDKQKELEEAAFPGPKQEKDYPVKCEKLSDEEIIAAVEREMKEYYQVREQMKHAGH